MKPILYALFILIPSSYLNAQIDTMEPNIQSGPYLDGLFLDADDEFSNRRYYSGMADYAWYDSNKYNLFIQYIYEPAMGNKKVSKDNKALLEDLKNYLSCSNPRNAGKCGVDILPIWPVYQFNYRISKDDEEDAYQSYVSIFTEFPFYEEKYHWDHDDTRLHHGLMKKKMHVVYSNYNETAGYTIKKYDDFKTVCSVMRTFILHKSDTSDFRKPAFCTPYKLDLIYRSDTVMNRILYDYNDWDNSGSYCDASQQQVSFAQLKGVPFLYFTTDVDQGDWFTYYPTRGIYLKLSSTMIVRLFDFRVEMVECSCI
jgi:hypothetical protein